MAKATQAERVLEYIEKFGSITSLEAANDLGCLRLASRISELKKQGFPIVSDTVAVKNRFGENCYVKQYKLEGCDQNGNQANC